MLSTHFTSDLHFSPKLELCPFKCQVFLGFVVVAVFPSNVVRSSPGHAKQVPYH